MKKKVIKIAAALVLLVAFLTVSCNTQTYFGRWMTWRASDIGDAHRFPSYPYKASASPFRFRPGMDAGIGEYLVPLKGETKLTLKEVLEQSGSTAFLVIANDTLVYEAYFNGYTRDSLNTSFSVAKSITSLMIGHALDKGYIESVSDPVTKYLPELALADARYNQLTLAHLLDMRSGTQFKDHDLPWGDKPKAYYDPQLRERVMHLPITSEPGTRFQYNSYNPILAGILLEKVTGKSPAQYFEENFWNPMHMEYDGSWSFDSESSRMTKMESGLNLRAIDFAKFGKLMLNNGEWNGVSLISPSWMEQCRAVNATNHLPEFGPEIHYSRFWWLHSKDHERAYILSGWGHLGQYLYVFPDEKIIIVRMGTTTGKVESWSAVFKAVVAQLTANKKK